jgi:signal transduction histidine kinase
VAEDRGSSNERGRRVDGTATLRSPGSDAAECRLLAERLNLDAVGTLRSDGGRRRVEWWAAPEIELVPLARILEGVAPGWITRSRGEDVVFAHLTASASVHSVGALSTLLDALVAGEVAEITDVTLVSEARGHRAGEADGVAPQDPIERERTRLAYAIHDGLTQVVTASVLELEWQARRAELEPEHAVDALAVAASELRKSLGEIRELLSDLSPHGDGGGRSLDELIRRVTERWSLPATWSVDGDLNAVPRSVFEVATSVIRESVANVAKHASSPDVAVAVHATSTGVEVRVEDAGRGFRPGGTGLHEGHLGLEMMRRRVAEVNGTLDIESYPGKGTRVVARLPLIDQGVKS